jgi:hypothetical protein
VLEELREELVAFKNGNGNQEVLEELAFNDRNGFDFCEAISNGSLEEVIELLK